MMTAALDGLALDATWHLRRICIAPKCVNPHHWLIEMAFSRSGRPPADIPLRLLRAMGESLIEDAAIAIPDADDLDPEEVSDAADMIMMKDARQIPVAGLVPLFHGLYSEATLNAALEQIRAGGL
jgi:hypothetical protein